VGVGEKKGGRVRLKQAGFKLNTRAWVDEFLRFSMWIEGAKEALYLARQGKALIVRYDRLPSDWKMVSTQLGVPDVSRRFVCGDSMEKVRRFLAKDTVEYLVRRTEAAWAPLKEHQY